LKGFDFVETKNVVLRDIPRTVDLDIVNVLVSYSVAICRIRDNDPNTFTPLGSGTFVIRNGLYGILTAHHCLHECSPEVTIGEQGRDKLLLALTRDRCLIVDPIDMREHPLAIPESAEFGPDLTFIEIFPGQYLDLLKAIVSFWNLDQNHEDSALRVSATKSLIVEAGFPQGNYRTMVEGSAIYHELKFLGFVGSLEDGDISERGKWDYIKSTLRYRASEKLPETLKGVSGGGIWAVKVLLLTNRGEWKIEEYCLVGVAFYETETIDSRKDVRGHFVRTIYQSAWEKLQ
jgi:hypothetical protein